MGNTIVKGTPPRDPERLASNAKRFLDNPDVMANSSGIGGDESPELIVGLHTYKFEENLSTKYPGTIVLGRDRAGIQLDGFEGGYGLRGDTECNSVDIVVGRKSCDEQFNILSSSVAPPDFINDAARIYISNRSDIDTYYSLPDGASGNVKKRSSVSAKADVIRLVGREGIKLVVGGDPKNSQRDVSAVGGVELMAGNLEKCNRTMFIKDKREEQINEIKEGGVQPIPLGINTAFAFSEAIDKIDKLAAVLSSCAMNINNFMLETARHLHPNLLNDYYGQPVQWSPDYNAIANKTSINIIQHTIKDIKAFRAELKTYKINHLKPNGAYYINSAHHKLN